jgi:hypothetical protein
MGSLDWHYYWDDPTGEHAEHDSMARSASHGSDNGELRVVLVLGGYGEHQFNQRKGKRGERVRVFSHEQYRHAVLSSDVQLIERANM